MADVQNPRLREILAEFGKENAFCQCDCPSCFSTRVVQRISCVRQALHTVLGAKLAESLCADMGIHWALFAAIASPVRTGSSGPAYEALCAISEADCNLVWQPVEIAGNV
jgi:hypothetical protein